MNIEDLLEQVEGEEQALLNTHFLAPKLRRSKIRTRVSGLIYTFKVRPRNFEGWGIFEPFSTSRARLVENASLADIDRYLQLLPSMRFRLAGPVENQTWIAYPHNESDAMQRFEIAHPVPIHLVNAADRFDTVIAHFDGTAWWFNQLDRAADPRTVEFMKNCFKGLDLPEELRYSGLTPEDVNCYSIALQQIRRIDEIKAERERMTTEGQLRQALSLGGANLTNYTERGDRWVIEWETLDGEQHTTSVSKTDLTVHSAGICLSGRSRDFDLQSIVGVIEERPGWMRGEEGYY